MNLNDKLVEQLSDELLECNCKPDPVKSKQVAERLASVLGEATEECIRRYIHSWILIWEARGNLEEAVRLQNLDINRKRSEIEAGDYDRYPSLLPEEIEYLQDSLYLQAIRFEKLGNKHSAIDCLCEVYDLANRYGIGPDEDTQALYAKLIAS